MRRAAYELAVEQGVSEAAKELSKRWKRTIDIGSLYNQIYRGGFRLQQKPPEVEPAKTAKPGPFDGLWQKYKPKPGWSPKETPPSQATKGRPERSIIIPDAHIPHHDRLVWAVVLGIVREWKPDLWIQLGDFLDGEGISDFGKQRLDMGSWAAECYAGNVALDELQNAAGGVPGIMLGGNHDDPGEAGRPGKYTARHEAMAEMLDVRKQLYIEPREYRRGADIGLRGIRYVPVKDQPYVSGPSAYFHGIGYEGVAFMRRIADAYIPANCPGKVLFGGHMHQLASASGIAGGLYQCCAFLGDKRDPVFSYRTKFGTPASWRHAVVLQETDGERMSYTVVEIANGKAVFGRSVVAAKL